MLNRHIRNSHNHGLELANDAGSEILAVGWSDHVYCLCDHRFMAWVELFLLIGSFRERVGDTGSDTAKPHAVIPSRLQTGGSKSQCSGAGCHGDLVLNRLDGYPFLCRVDERDELKTTLKRSNWLRQFRPAGGPGPQFKAWRSCHINLHQIVRLPESWLLRTFATSPQRQSQHDPSTGPIHWRKVRRKPSILTQSYNRSILSPPYTSNGYANHASSKTFI